MCFLDDGSTENNCGLDGSFQYFGFSGTGPVAFAGSGYGTCYRAVELEPTPSPTVAPPSVVSSIMQSNLLASFLILIQ